LKLIKPLRDRYPRSVEHEADRVYSLTVPFLGLIYDCSCISYNTHYF